MKNTPYLCREDEEARLLRRAPGERELRELEFEGLQGQREAVGGARKTTFAHTKRPTRIYRACTIDWHARIYDGYVRTYDNNAFIKWHMRSNAWSIFYLLIDLIDTHVLSTHTKRKYVHILVTHVWSTRMKGAYIKYALIKSVHVSVRVSYHTRIHT